MGIAMADISYDAAERTYILPLTEENLNRVRNMRNVVEIAKYEAEGTDPNVFPHDPNQYAWNADNYGPLWIPAKGATVQLTTENLPLYRRIIEIYEGNKLEVKNGVIYINDQPTKEYTFKMDYYFMMGITDTIRLIHVLGICAGRSHCGKSLNGAFLHRQRKTFPKNIRWNRMFTRIK